MDIILSSSVPSVLLPALPFVLSTPDTHIIPSHVIERGQLPANTSLTKLFWSEDVENLKQEFLSVRDLGSSAAEEWLKGLEGRGVQRRHDYSRWEKFASSGGVLQLRTMLYPGYQPPRPLSRTGAASPLLPQRPPPAVSAADVGSSGATTLPSSISTSPPLSQTPTPSSGKLWKSI